MAEMKPVLLIFTFDITLKPNMLEIRLVRPSDLNMVINWWESASMHGFTSNYLPSDSSYMVLIDKQPAAVLALYKTNIKEYAYLECYVSNPEISKDNRRKATEHLVNYIEEQARQLGYHKLVCLTHIEALKPRYAALGYIPSLNNVTTFVKEL